MDAASCISLPYSVRPLEPSVSQPVCLLFPSIETGYRGSVFNLVFVNNIASVRIWDQLGFQRAGLIPGAGRLKKKDNPDEDEYVDAIVFHYDFVKGTA